MLGKYSGGRGTKEGRKDMMARTDKEGSQERRVERHSEKAMEVSRLLKRGSGVIE